MEFDERAPTDPFECCDSASAWPAVGMGRTIQQFRQHLAGADGRIVLILSKYRDALGASFRELVLWKYRRTGNIQHELEDGVEILRQTRAGEGHRVTSRS